MKGILKIAIVVGLAYAVWLFAVPWIRDQVGRSRPPVSSPVRGRGGACVQAAARASEQLHDRMLETGRGLLEPAAWNEVTAEVEWTLQQAQQDCGCELESCAGARGALAKLREIFLTARTDMRSSQSVPFAQGREYEKANQELWKAYELAREGR